MYKVSYSSRALRDMKRMGKRGKDLAKLYEVFDLLKTGEPLPVKYRDHPLRGGWNGLVGCRDCHIEPDWLLIYRKVESELTILACGTGTHSDLF